MPGEARLIVDIGGEGRHPHAWNVNPSKFRTIGSLGGQPIPRLIQARAFRLPFADDSVDLAIVERTPLSRAALEELDRVLSATGRLVLRHVPLPRGDRHALAQELIRGTIERRTTTIGRQQVIETVIDRAAALVDGC